MRNETVNLAFGEGNTLLRAAELIAEQLDIQPLIDTAPARIGEVTHYIADIRKAHDLLGWQPETSLDDGIPKAVEWFLEHRGAHPEENATVPSEGEGVGLKAEAHSPDRQAASGR